MKNCLLRSFQALLVFSLAFTLTNCGNLDNPLEELSGGGGSGSSVSVTSIELNKTTLDMKVGDADVTLTATVAPDNATDKTVTWSSDKESVATVTDGVVHAVAVGTAIITAKAGDKTAICEVTVLPTLSTPLTVEAITAGKITVTSPKSGMKFSKNGGAKQAVTTDAIPVAAGDKVAFYGTATSYNGTKIGGADDGGTFKCKVYGNIMSLVDETNFATNYNTLTEPQTFESLFQNNKKLTDASGLLLPATTLIGYCYRYMFYDCSSLTAAPKELPALNLATNCYMAMFYGCTSLTATPKLPATTLSTDCYDGMFKGCTSLTTAYVKADYDGGNCQDMFLGCTNDGTCTLYTDGNWSSCTDISNWTKNAYPTE